MADQEKLFAFNESLIRVAGTAENPLFVAADICRALGLENSRDTIGRLPEDEKGVANCYTLGGTQQMQVVTESGLYRLIFRSNKPEAEQFRKWVFSEVLPAIRRDGFYAYDKVQLWKAFAEAKTGKVQIALLSALGISRETEIEAPAMLKMTAEEFWDDIGKAWEKAKLQIRAEHCGRNDFLHCFVSPDGLLDILKAENPKYQDISRADLRLILQSSNEWMPGSHRVRLGAANAVAAVWGFKVAKDSGTRLASLYHQLQQI